MNNNEYMEIIAPAVKFADVNPKELREIVITKNEPYYEVSFSSDYMSYDLYVSPEGEITGFMAEPLEEVFMPDKSRTIA